jgi:hypothetical protein
MSFQRRDGELRLVVVLPDGTPGMIAVNATDVFGEVQRAEWPVTALTVEGVRRLRSAMGAHDATVKAARSQRRRLWKVVRHDHGVDPFDRLIWVYSSHTTELAARRARDRVRAVMVRASGYEVAARSTWSVVRDPVGSLVNPPADDGSSAR